MSVIMQRQNHTSPSRQYRSVASTVPDHLCVSNVCTVRRQLDLLERCLPLTTDAYFNAFSVQMELTAGLTRSSIPPHGLRCQSSALARLIPVDAHDAPWFGDGATAVIVGPATQGFGLLASERCRPARTTRRRV
jgi:3-oxoacyl-[acyl-carrier-protein] synthase-3